MSLPGLQSFYGDLHKRTLTDLAEIDAAEIEKPSRLWEDEPMSLRFRMHRFDSHLRQHTIQVEKSLQRIGHIPNECQRLLRLIFFALAQVEEVSMGTGEIMKSCCWIWLTRKYWRDNFPGELVAPWLKIALLLTQ